MTPDPMGYPIMAVLDDAIDALVSATGGVFAIPAGGYLNVTRLSKKRCYRLTLDVVIHPPEKRAAPEAWGARRVLAFEKASA